MLENQRIARERTALARDELNYRRERDTAAANAERQLNADNATKEELGLAFYVAAQDPDYKRGRELLGKVKGIDPNIVDTLPEAQVRDLYGKLGQKFSGIAPDDEKLGQ